MFKHILVPVDGSPAANAALKQAIMVARAFDARLTVATVIDPFPFVAIGRDSGYAQAQYIEAIRKESATTIKAARTIVEAEGLQAEQLVEENSRTSRGIIDAANSSHADLIVMGSHGRHGLDKMLMGSVTQSVLQRTTLPVMVVREVAA